ncbi:MAG TPA: inositol monophosphatase family protein [Gaiellaceae bacterium]
MPRDAQLETDALLELCRGSVQDIRAELKRLPTREEREKVLRRGMGGDETTQIDEAAEQAVVRRLEALDVPGFTLVSEELGERVFGAGGSLRVVLDPIDGSINAKRGIPFFSVSLAVADGDKMRDVFFGYVYDFGSGEEWTARRGKGAWLNGEVLGATRPKDEIELLAFEATETAKIAERAPSVVGLAKRLRIMGSLALSLCHLAAGRLDAVCSLKPARSIDVAAGQLLVREVGLAIEFVDGEASFLDSQLDLESRSRIAAAGTEELCRALSDRLRS